MTKRETILVVVAVSLLAVIGGSVAFYQFVYKPALAYHEEADKKRADITKANLEAAKEAGYKARFQEIAGETLGIDENAVSEQLRTRIAEVLNASGMSAANLSLKPLVGSRVPGVYKEIGWLVRARGKETDVVRFLYLMNHEAHLHRVDNVSLTPIPNTGEVEILVKFATLVLEAPVGEKLPELNKVAEQPATLVLKGAELAPYDTTIVARDLFRPYIKARPVTPTPTIASVEPRERPTFAKSTDQQPVTSRYKLIGLPAVGGKPEILISDSSSGKIATYKQGDELIGTGGKIVTVDYRPLPKPNKPRLVSESRVVLQKGGEYLALELGSYLTETRKLPADQVPPELPKLVPVAPKVDAKAATGSADVKAPAKAVARPAKIEPPAAKVEAVEPSEPKVDVKAPVADTKEPTPPPAVEVKEPKVDTPPPAVDAKEPKTDTKEPKADVKPDAKDPNVDAKQPKPDVKEPKADVKEPSGDSPPPASAGVASGPGASADKE